MGGTHFVEPAVRTALLHNECLHAESMGGNNIHDDDNGNYSLIIVRNIVLRLPVCGLQATRWNVRGSNLGKGRSFRHPSTPPFGPPILLYNEYRVCLPGHSSRTWR